MSLLRDRLIERGSALLFGSRARQDSHWISDFDVLVLHDNVDNADSLRYWARGYSVDLFVIDLASTKEEIERMNTVLLDALLEGVILFDDLDTIEELKEFTLDMVRTRGLKRRKDGGYW